MQPVQPVSARVDTAGFSATQLAKAALRRLVADRVEPTPENYARAYHREAGVEAGAPASAEALALLIERIIRGVERGGQQWTMARRKEAIQRVLSGSRSDVQRLQSRLSNLLARWEGDADAGGAAPGPAVCADTAAATDEPDDALCTGTDATVDRAAAAIVRADTPAPGSAAIDTATTTTVTAGATPDAPDWQRVVGVLSAALRQALPQRDGTSHELAVAIDAATGRVLADGAGAAQVDALQALCDDAGRVLQHRHRLFEQLGGLCRELTASLAELAENDSWVRGQCEAMRLQLDAGLNARGVRAVSEMLHSTRSRHSELRREREQARDALKLLINRMLSELAELGSKTGHFHESVGRYATVIEGADSLESLTGVVREMVEESRTVQSLVQQTQQRLQDEHTKASDLSQRVDQLEGEMRRLSDEVSTDQLTQIANRRGLMQAFDAERARLERSGGSLAVGLLDIDNFKRLNDELGHSAGDEALKTLAALVSRALRPSDRVARYGGEEFALLLPETSAAQGELVLTRLQRALTGGLFMHKNKQVFVTFSAGVTAYRADERIEEALERADQALYEAKRSGKNRTCIG